MITGLSRFYDLSLTFDRRGAMNDDESVNGESTTMLRTAIDDGIAELDAGLGQEMTVEDLMAEVRREVGLVAGVAPTS